MATITLELWFSMKQQIACSRLLSTGDWILLYMEGTWEYRVPSGLLGDAPGDAPQISANQTVDRYVLTYN